MHISATSDKFVIATGPIRRIGLRGRVERQEPVGGVLTVCRVACRSLRASRQEQVGPRAILKFRLGRLTPAAGAAAPETCIGEQPKGCLQPVTPPAFRLRILKTGKAPQPGAGFEFNARKRIDLRSGLREAINGSASSRDGAERTCAWPVAPQQAATFGIGGPLLGQNG